MSENQTAMSDHQKNGWARRMCEAYGRNLCQAFFDHFGVVLIQVFDDEAKTFTFVRGDGEPLTLQMSYWRAGANCADMAGRAAAMELYAEDNGSPGYSAPNNPAETMGVVTP